MRSKGASMSCGELALDVVHAVAEPDDGRHRRDGVIAMTLAVIGLL